MERCAARICALRSVVCLLMGVVALALGACGDTEDGVTASDPDIVLPSMSAAGRLPPPDRRVDIVIDDQGGLFVGGAPVTLSDLGAALVEATGGNPKRETVFRTATQEEALEEDVEETPEDIEEVHERDVVAEEPIIRDAEVDDAPFSGPRGDDPIGVAPSETRRSNAEILAGGDDGPFEADGSLTANAVIWVAPSVPAEAVARVLMAMADPSVKLYRVFFAVTSEASRSTRAVAVFLPKDRGLCGVDRGPAPDLVRVSFIDQGFSANAKLIGDVIRSKRRSEDPIAIRLVLKPHVSMQQVLDVVDAALQAGAVGLTIDGFPPSEESLRDIVADGRNAPDFGVKVGDTLVAGHTTGDPRADWPDYLGFSNDHPPLEAVIEEELVEETPDRDG